MSNRHPHTGKNRRLLSTKEETCTDEEIFDVLFDVLGERLAERHALVRVVLFASQTSRHQILDDRRRLLDRKQRRRLHAVRVFVLDLLDAPSVHVHRDALSKASSTFLGRRHYPAAMYTTSDRN